MTLVLGCDPGLSGAIALISSDGSLVVDDMPTHALTRNGKAKREIDLYGLARLIDGHNGKGGLDHAFVEAVNSMPGQGVSSVFSFGQSFGILKGVLAANFVPMTLVPPPTWKRVLKVPADKDGARARASQLLPRYSGLWARVKDDGRAEAALIALYGIQQVQAQGAGL